MGWFAERRAALLEPSGGGHDHLLDRGARRSEQFIRTRRIPDPRMVRFFTNDHWLAAKQFTEARGQLADRHAFDPGYVERRWRRGGVLETLDGSSVGISLPDDVRPSHADIDMQTIGDFHGHITQ